MASIVRLDLFVFLLRLRHYMLSGERERESNNGKHWTESIKHNTIDHSDSITHLARAESFALSLSLIHSLLVRISPKKNCIDKNVIYVEKIWRNHAVNINFGTCSILGPMCMVTYAMYNVNAVPTRTPHLKRMNESIHPRCCWNEKIQLFESKIEQPILFW